ncbi:hypothetical protein V6N11_067021 [Hibiscus sabdariffa]|uniref:Secreted protein n=1 Tax=Hibiscus sabdariffa TaxID=183260 RepID=A0ABR2SPG6_9ROSI
MAFLVVLILGGALKVCVAAVNVDKQHITLQSTQVCAAAVNMDKYQYAGFRWASYRCINAHKETALHYIIAGCFLHCDLASAVDSPNVQSRAKMSMGLVNRYASYEFKVERFPVIST